MKLKQLIEEMKGRGAEVGTFRYYSGELLTEADTLTLRSVASSEATAVQEKVGVKLAAENAMLVKRCHPVKAYDLDELLSTLRISGQLPPSEAVADLVLVLDCSIQCQIKLLEELGYSDATSRGDLQMTECKRLLELIWVQCQFTLYMVAFQGVVLVFSGRLNAGNLQGFFKDIVNFKERYGIMDLSESQLRKLTLESGSIAV